MKEELEKYKEELRKRVLAKIQHLKFRKENNQFLRAFEVQNEIDLIKPIVERLDFILKL